ncbi:MAG: arylesterase [Syntrophobacteraceae bacterium]
MDKKTRYCSVAVACMFILLLLPVGVCEGREKVSPSAGRNGRYEGTIVAFGDSLTKGFRTPREYAYPRQLEKRLHSGEGDKAKFLYEVLNKGIGGEKTGEALSRVNSILSLKPDIVILEIGINDGHRNIEIGVIEKNINEIVRILKEHKVIVILAGIQLIKKRNEEYANAFENIYPRVAERQGVILVPFQKGVAGNPSLNYPDGIHPNAEGNRIVVSNVYPYVIEAIKKVRATRKRISKQPADSIRSDSFSPGRSPVPGSYQKSPALSPPPSGS